MVMVEYNHSNDIETSIKNLSNESKALLGELERMSIKAAELISHLYASLRSDGLDPQAARKLIEDKIAVSDRTLRRALPEEAKQQSKVRPQFADKMTAKSKADRMSASSNARLVVDEEPNIPAPEQPIIEAQQEPEPEAEKELVHRTIRITMSAGQLSGLSKEMKSKLDKYGRDTNYVIEYDYVDKALYVDLAEKWETELMVND